MIKGAAPQTRLRRAPLLLLGIVSLVLGVWGGLLRLSIPLPFPKENANWITFHGPLMVCGFLGTVIGLERAVGLQRAWTYLPPILSGAGALIIAAGFLGSPGAALITAGSAGFVIVTWRVVQLQRALFTVVMSIGGLLWFIGNSLWLYNCPFHKVVPWWIGFLGLTIVGERLDLSRFQKQAPAARPLFLGALLLFLAGVAASAFSTSLGQRILGAGLVALALWMGRFDIARRAVKQPGLPRFMAVCLLGGYVWMAAAGVLLVCMAPLESGPLYDAALHSFFLGFVFGMIFGHAPMIFPSVLQMPALGFSQRLYSHVLLLHGSLLLRVVGDLAGWESGRRWGAALNAMALALFLANTVVGLVWRR